MNHTWVRPAVVAVVLTLSLGIAAPSSASTINALSSVFLIDDGPGNLLFEQEHFFFVPRFNPGFGTLDALTISVIKGATMATIVVDNESPFFAAVFSDSVSAVAFTEVSYAGGSLAESNVSVDIGPIPGLLLPPDSDGAPDFIGNDVLAFSGSIPVDIFDQTIVTPATLSDFTGVGSLLITLTISEIGGVTIPGLHGFTASYGAGIGAISLNYEYTPAEEPVPVPEPGTLCLVAAGIAMSMRRRRPSAGA